MNDERALAKATRSDSYALRNSIAVLRAVERCRQTMRAAESIAAVQLKMKEDAHENDKETLRNQLKIVHDRMVSSKKILRSELTKITEAFARVNSTKDEDMKNMEQRYTENIESMRRELKRRQKQEEISGVQVKQLLEKIAQL